MIKASLFVLAFALTLSACASSAAPTPTAPTGAARLTLTSSAFAEGEAIPQKFTCHGSDLSPALKWSGAPSTTRSFALIVDDPDAPLGVFTHWVVFDIPATQTEIAEGALSAGTSGRNSSGKTGYMGPCPPSGVHRYVFTLYALDVDSLKLNAGATKDQVLAAMQGHILAQGSLMGKYGK